MFPRSTKFAYRVTLKTEFDEMLGKRFGAHGGSRSFNQMLADMDVPTEYDGRDDSPLDSAAVNDELVKFVNKVIIDARSHEAFHLHIDLMPGKIKTGIRFRIDGTLQPQIKASARFH